MSLELKEIDSQLQVLKDKKKLRLTDTSENNTQNCDDSDNQEGDGSRDEDDMPSAEIDLSEGHERASPGQEEDSVATDSSSNEDLAQLPGAEGHNGAKKLLESKNPIRDLDKAAVEAVSDEDVKCSIQNLAIDGTVMKEGDMIHFIAKNLESKIRLSSPDISEHARHGQSVAAPESTFLAQLEREARCIAASVDGLTEHLAVSLHTISAVTAQSLTVYKDSVCKTCDAMDSNIKSMYQLMAKCEELSKAMNPIYKLADQVKEIKKLLDIMENLS
uniref:EOG090X0FS7 n=1 Tax=Daphnia dolichocephala TaxID=2282166 RepID=A0A4Y7M2L7_9CRUS|nr:EOG090X0FS7 [Daphnia dolichocephala]